MPYLPTIQFWQINGHPTLIGAVVLEIFSLLMDGNNPTIRQANLLIPTGITLFVIPPAKRCGDAYRQKKEQQKRLIEPRKPW
jgi:hypothetical protein